MVDLVGTCPKDFWLEWIAEGDAAGDPEAGEEWSWFTKDRLALQIHRGDRFYVVAHGRLRGYAPVMRVDHQIFFGGDSRFAIIRKGGAVAVTVDEAIPGFRGLRRRWWNPASEKPFPDWKEANTPAKQGVLV